MLCRQNTMKLQDLPDCMLEQIFEHLSYDEISKKRLVSSLDVGGRRYLTLNIL